MKRDTKRSKIKRSEVYPPVDLYWFFEISIRTEKKIQLELKKNFSYKLTEICSLKFFFSSRLRSEKKISVSTEKKDSVGL